MSAEALPSMLPTLGTLGATAIASPIIGTVPIVGGAAAIATRLIAPLVPGFLMGGGETYEEAKKLGADDKTAQTYGVAGGVGIGLLEKIGAAHALKNLINTAGRDYTVKKLSEQVGKKTVKKAENMMDEILKDENLFIKRNLFVDAGKNAVKAGAVEGVTEGAQEALQLGAASLAADKGINAYENAEATNRIIDAAALGIVGGKVAGTGAGIVSNLQHKDVVNRAKDRLEKLNEIQELRKKEGDMSDEKFRELLNTIDVKDEKFKPSFIDNLFRQSLTPLAPLSKKSSAGYEIVTALKNYYDNVSKDVGTYARPMDEALSQVRRSIKAPLVQGSISNKKNKDETLTAYVDRMKKAYKEQFKKNY